MQSFKGGAGQGAHRHITYGSRNGAIEGACLRGRPLHWAHRLEGQARQGDALGFGGLGHKPVRSLGELMAYVVRRYTLSGACVFVRRCDCLKRWRGRTESKSTWLRHPHCCHQRRASEKGRRSRHYPVTPRPAGCEAHMP